MDDGSSGGVGPVCFGFKSDSRLDCGRAFGRWWRKSHGFFVQRNTVIAVAFVVGSRDLGKADLLER
jgi:hypothetical protein